jgi:RNA polymerase sigma-70 factor (ECF subfamily)
VAIPLDGADHSAWEELKESKTPEAAYDRAWALALLAQARKQLRVEWAARGRGALYDAIGPDPRPQPVVPLAKVAEKLGLTEDAVKMAAHRLRQRYVKLIHELALTTVGREEDLREEMQLLMEALRES